MLLLDDVLVVVVVVVIVVDEPDDDEEELEVVSEFEVTTGGSSKFAKFSSDFLTDDVRWLAKENVKLNKINKRKKYRSFIWKFVFL